MLFAWALWTRIRLLQRSHSSQSFGNQEIECIRNTKSGPAENTQKPMPRQRTDRAWFSRLLQPTRKWSRSILSTPESAWGRKIYEVEEDVQWCWHNSSHYHFTLKLHPLHGRHLLSSHNRYIQCHVQLDECAYIN